jgi:hypothetical protein
VPHVLDALFGPDSRVRAEKTVFDNAPNGFYEMPGVEFTRLPDGPFGWKGREREAPRTATPRCSAELDTLIHCEQRVVLPAHAPKQITVLDPGAAADRDRGRGMALEHGGEV